MSYPMTWQRVVNRNRLQDGDYGSKMSGLNTKPWDREVLARFNDDADRVDLLLGQRETVCREIDTLNNRWGALLGDIRRLEQDVVDEQAIAKQIAHRLGIADDFVAAVLKEFMSI